MKYIKQFENISKDPKVGDYVICEEGNPELKEFIENNIGQICRIYTEKYNPIYPKYYIKYDNIPDDLKGFSILNGIKVRIIFSHNILFYSNSIEELELKISANKYNL